MSQLKILIFDDEIGGLGKLFLHLLENEYIVEITMDPAEITTRFKRLVPGIVILNHDVPGFDSVEICKVIKLESKVPIILLLEKTSSTTIAIDGCNADEVIYKPVDVIEVVHKIKQLLAFNS